MCVEFTPPLTWAFNPDQMSQVLLRHTINRTTCQILHSTNEIPRKSTAPPLQIPVSRKYFPNRGTLHYRSTASYPAVLRKELSEMPNYIPMADILVTTLTCGRKSILKECFETFTDKNPGIDYHHVVVDQGSSDGTDQWLKHAGVDHITLPENVGICEGWRTAYRKYPSADFYILMDDDCLVDSDNVLAEMMSFYESFGENYVLAARNETLMSTDRQQYIPMELNTVPRPRPDVTERRHGGLFVCVPRNAFVPFARMDSSWDDMKRCGYWRERGYPTMILDYLKCYHLGRAAGPGQRGEYKY